MQQESVSKFMHMCHTRPLQIRKASEQQYSHTSGMKEGTFSWIVKALLLLVDVVAIVFVGGRQQGAVRPPVSRGKNEGKRLIQITVKHAHPYAEAFGSMFLTKQPHNFPDVFQRW